MSNIDMSVDGDQILTIKIDLKKRLGKSASGKNTIIATSSGNVSVPGFDGVKIGVNCYTREQD